MAVVASLALVSGAKAQIYFTGSVSVVDFYGGGSAASDSLTLAPLTLLTTGQGDYASGAGFIPSLSDVTGYTGTITGIGLTPTAENINNYLAFSLPDSFFNSAGTTPGNRFVFDLSTIESLGSPSPVFGFYGQGTLIDTQGYFANTPAEFTLNFSSANNYSLTIASAAPVPEPATISLTSIGLMAAMVIRRRRA